MNTISKAVTLLGLALGVTACGYVTPPKAAVPNAPVPFPEGPRSTMVVQKTFRIGTLDFGAECGDDDCDGKLNKAIPAALLTELKQTGRFSVYEAGAIRVDGLFAEGNAHAIVDAYLSGKITRKTAEEVCFDVWLSNANSHEVLYAQTTCAKVTGATAATGGDDEKPQKPGTAGDVDREGIKLLAQEIARSIKQVGSAQVTSVSGQLVYVNKGQKSDVMPGMVAYLVATGDTTKDETIHTKVEAYTGVQPAGLPAEVVGQIYIVSVEGEHSVGKLFAGDYALPGDTVFFK